MNKLYFDYNATTPVHPRVFKAMAPYLRERFGNPGSAHAWGAPAAEAVERARVSLATLIGAEPEEIVFTSGATESNNLALYGTLPHMRRSGLVTSSVEHPAVTGPALALKQRGHFVGIAAVNEDGLVDLGQLRALTGDQTGLVSIMLANNEVGTLQPVAEIARIAREAGALVHSDAAQAVGKVRVDVNELGVDLLSVAGHKMYAPKGVGALYVRRGTPIQPVAFGGGQEDGIRPGTENVPHIAALGEAAAMALEDLEAEEQRLRSLGDKLLRGVRAMDAGVRVNAENAPRLPSTLSVGFRGLRAGDLLSGLAALDTAVSGGAACHAGETRVSGVLTAMNVPREYAEGTIRISWGRMTSEGDVREFLKRLGKVAEELSNRR